MIAGDTGTYFFRAICLRKPGQIGIGNQGPDHFNPISLLFSKNSFSSVHVTVPTPTGPFANLPGIMIAQNPDIDFENGADPGAQQRIRVAFDITFSNTSLGDFPGSGSQTYELDAFV